RAGKGGDGAVTFHREKFMPRGGPDGGDGGNGGDVILHADSNMDDLSKFQSFRSFRAEAGQPGGPEKRSGKNAPDLLISVPVGTLVRDVATEPAAVLADLSQHGDSRVVAGGGRGGWGNLHFVTSSKQMPMHAKPGLRGDERQLQLELRLMADIALVGPPNTGKSTLLKDVSNAPATVGDYPFTTREPVLGSVDLGTRDAVIVELPGILPGANEGRGLGVGFLRHAQRAGALVYVIAGDSPDPIADYEAVLEEVYLYDDGLKAKPQFVAINKFDLPEVKEKKATLKRKFRKLGVTPSFISASSGDGVRELIENAAQAAQAAQKTAVSAEVAETPVTVFRPTPKRRKTQE
ncbi:MAG: GTPase ObgE, partial [Dehalococcoidia bacterium]|nr:GTPase ObgE [Dehalococcoidia bacterium]